MKSRTSFFNAAVLKKDITRFAPVWVLYLVGLVLFLISNGSYINYPDVYASNIASSMVGGFGFVNLIYAGICAIMLYGDLFNTKMCYSLHSMPLRREHWLLSHLAAGMLFSLMPNTLASLVLMSQLGEYWFLAFYWLLAVTLQFVFFYGLASLSVMLTGNRFAMLAVYAGFNFIALLVYCTVEFLFVPMLTGVVSDVSGFARFSPAVQLTNFKFFQFNSLTINIESPIGPKPMTRTYYEYIGLGDGWGYLIVLVAVGLALMAGAWWLYRKRHLECAGDFVAFPRLKGIVSVVITVCVALCFALVGELFDSSGYGLWLAIGLVIGFFGGLMLLERQLKVFRKKTFLGFAVMAGVVILSFTAVSYDWFGIESYIPRAEKVESVTIYNYNYKNYTYMNGGYDEIYYYGRLSLQLTDPEEIEDIITAHEDILDRLDSDTNGEIHRVTISYTLKSGRTVIRTYAAPADGVNYDIFRKYFHNEKTLLGYGNRDWENFVSTITDLNVNYFEIPAQLLPEVMEALRKDCATGGVHILGHMEPEYFVNYYIRDASGNVVMERYLAITAQAENFCALMKNPQLQMGYTDWDAFLQQDMDVVYDGEYVTGDSRIALLEAIRKDVEAGNLTMGGFNQNTLFVIYFNNKNYSREFCVDKYAEHTLQWYKEYIDSVNPEGV